MRHFSDAPAIVPPASRVQVSRAGWAARAMVALGCLAAAPAQDVDGPLPAARELRVGFVTPASVPEAQAPVPEPRPLFPPALGFRTPPAQIRAEMPDLRAATIPLRTWSPSPDASAAGWAVHVSDRTSVTMAVSRDLRPDGGEDRSFSVVATLGGL